MDDQGKSSKVLGTILLCKRRRRILVDKDDDFCWHCWCYDLPEEEVIKFEHRGECIEKNCEEVRQ